MNIRISGLSTKSRREFLRSAGIAAAAVLVPRMLPAARIFAPAAAAYKYPNPGKIVIVHHPHAVIGANNADAAIVQRMFDQAVMQFTGITSSPADALASLFPALTTAKRIAIKPNIYNASVPARKELAKALVTRLVQMLGGFPAANITFYERHSFASAGYTAAYFGQAVNFVTDTAFPDLGYTMHCDGKDRPYSRTLHDADYLINMPVLKSCACGVNFPVTLAFKNHMGTVNPAGSLGIHANKTAVLDIMADPVMTAKQRIVLTDCLFAMYNGGPSGLPQATPQRIMLSQDPVTSDYQGMLMINELRVANGYAAVSVPYIGEAALPPYDIGIADPARMNVITSSLVSVQTPQAAAFRLEQNHPNPFATETEIVVHCAEATRLRVEVADASGRMVALLLDAAAGAGATRLRWDASRCASGVYTCRATSRTAAQEIRMTLLR
ncbi:MAG: DUF362 domain-containing protein [Ignavibacteria bacterium]|nr:DUF362 domain-containing protein [Ignavibacteria bacterium]